MPDKAYTGEMRTQSQLIQEDEKLLLPFFPDMLVRWLAGQGIPANDVLLGSGLSMQALSSAQTRLSIKQVRHILLRAMSLSKNQHLGVDFGRQINLMSMGKVGYAAMSSPTLEHALLVFQRYLKLRDPLVQTSLTRNKAHAILSFKEPVDYGEIRHFMFMAIANALHTIVQFLLPSVEQLPFSIELNYPSPDDWDSQVLPAGMVVQFSCSSSRIVFPGTWLEKTLPTADKQTAEQVQRLCENDLLAYQSSEGLANQVRAFVVSEMTGYLSMEECAESLAISSRTLRRLLAGQNLTFLKIVDQVRYEKASDYLLNSELSIAQIAEQLNYADPSNFSRAFLTWTGKRPSKYRESGHEF